MRTMKMLAVLLMLGNMSGKFAVAISKDKKTLKQHFADTKGFAANQASKFSIQGAHQQLLPTEKDKEFVRKNKDEFDLKEEDILNASKSRFDQEVAAGKTFDPNAINPKDLNERSMILSQKNDAASKDRSGMTPKDYMDIVVKSDEKARKYQKDVEEKPFLDAAKIIEDPQKILREKYGIGIDCIEEETDTQKELEPDVETYQEAIRVKETVEENKTCEESEPVTFQCERKLNLSCAKEEIAKKDPNKMDWSEDLRRIANGMPSSGLLGEYVKIEALAKFLGAKGVCIKNIISHLERFNSYFMFKEEHKDIFTKVVALINPSELGNNKCEIPQEKKCVKWKEEWKNKCEQDLKQLG